MWTWIRSSTCAFVVVGLMSGPAVAQTVTVMAILDGGDIVPARVLTGAVGFAEFTVDAAKSEISFKITLFNFSTRVTGAHVHVGALGVGGPIVFDLRPTGQSGDLNLTGTLRPADARALPDLGIRTADDAVQSMVLGGTYIDVHTERNSDGEIRGQMFPTDTSAVAAKALVQRFSRDR